MLFRALRVEGGLRGEAIVGDTSTTRVVSPEPEIVTLAGEARVESSIFAALEAEGIPARFAIDLAQMLEEPWTSGAICREARGCGCSGAKRERAGNRSGNPRLHSPLWNPATGSTRWSGQPTTPPAPRSIRTGKFLAFLRNRCTARGSVPSSAPRGILSTAPSGPPP